MSGQQIGHYAPPDIAWIIEHDGSVLAEVQEGGVSWDIALSNVPAGAGLGFLKNTYFKAEAPPKATGKIARNLLQRSDKGMLFLDLVEGSRYVISEAIAAASTTYTVTLNTVLVSILEIKLNVSGTVLREGLDFTVNYVTGVITFPIATPEVATIRYLASSRALSQYLINGGFEDAITNIWIAVATAALARDSANAYTEGFALKVTPSASNDGIQYNISTNLQPGRQYRLRGMAKAAAAETLVGKWNDGTTDQTMTVVSGGTLTTTFAPFEMTFTTTKSVVPNIKILDSKVSPGIFYLDNVVLLDDTTGNNPTLGNNPMDAGLGVPFMFNLIGRRVLDNVVAHKLMRCALTKIGYKSGKQYQESVDFEFLDWVRE